MSSRRELTTTREMTNRFSKLTDGQSKVTIGADGLIYGLKPPERRGFWQRNPTVIRIISVIVVLIAWELYGRSLNPIFLSYPTAVVPAFWELITDGRLWEATRESLAVLAIGMAIFSVGRVLIGVLMGLNKVADHPVSPRPERYVPRGYLTVPPDTRPHVRVHQSPPRRSIRSGPSPHAGMPPPGR